MNYKHSDTSDDDRYDHLASQFDSIHDRQARRKRKAKVKHQPKVTERDMLVEMTGEEFSLDMEGMFNISYTPSLYESGWLLTSLRSFFDQSLIQDINAVVKGGKEATVYRCQAGLAMPNNVDWVAAKVYRPRQFRNLSNDKMYREGRGLLSSKGDLIKNTDHRTMRAIGKKSAFGQQVEHTSWLMYEFKTLQTLYDAGAAVPQPIEVNENTILMTYYGDETSPATTLNKVRLERAEARRLFNVVMDNIELMLEHDMIHGDLSPYNMLYWDGEIVLIDFPQVVESHHNSHSYFILKRDVERVCDYFIKQGVDINVGAMVDRLWTQYVAETPENLLADHWVPEIDDEDDDDFEADDWEMPDEDEAADLDL